MSTSSTPKPTPPRGEEAARLLEAALEPPKGSGERAVPPTKESLAPRFPDLEIEELIGAGGMGVVYRARHRRLDRPVALKILPESLGKDPEFAERFAREARMLARLDHAHIVRVHDFGVADGLYFLILEYVDGANLRQVMATGGLSPAEALAIVPQVCDALQYAHDQGVVHRDIKPENVLLDRKGQVKIADFGLAKLVGRDGLDTSVTATGQVMGTMQYMAPEQYRTPGEVDHRADIFSLGVVFYEMLTGELPVGVFKSPSESIALDTRLDAIVLRALERERALRYQRAGDMRTDVSRLSETVGSTAQGDRASQPAASSGSAGPTAQRRDGKVPAILSALTLPLGLLAVALTHDAWGGVERGTADALGRGIVKGVVGGAIWLTGALLALTAMHRGASAKEPRRIYRRSLVLLIVQLSLLPLLAIYVAGDVKRHSSSRGDKAPTSEYRDYASLRDNKNLVVRGLPAGVDPRPVADSVKAAWGAYVERSRTDIWDADLAVTLYVQADAAQLPALLEDYRKGEPLGRELGIAVLSTAVLGGPAEAFAVRRIEVDPDGRSATVYVYRTEPDERAGWKFPMARDVDGQWRFGLGRIDRVTRN